uniref:CSON014230 protein n=1 Tax=Culicoides sonorensis TaxID=179676 RepID=A0A336KD69_CULSO
MNLNEKAVIILGGLGGIGKAICKCLNQNGVKKLAIIDILNEDCAVAIFKFLDISSSELNLIYKKCCVTDKDLLNQHMSEIKSEFGSLDIVINAAGIANEIDPEKLIAVNFHGTVNSSLTAINLMRKDMNKSSNGGTIINIASVAALRPVFFLPIYSGTKHAILGFTRSLIDDAFYNRTGIKFIVICPGATRTPIVGKEHVIDKFLFPEMLDQVKKLSKEMKFQEPEIVAKCILTALEDNENGSVWQCENSRMEKLNIYNYNEF